MRTTLSIFQSSRNSSASSLRCSTIEVPRGAFSTGVTVAAHWNSKGKTVCPFGVCRAEPFANFWRGENLLGNSPWGHAGDVALMKIKDCAPTVDNPTATNRLGDIVGYWPIAPISEMTKATSRAAYPGNQRPASLWINRNPVVRPPGGGFPLAVGWQWEMDETAAPGASGSPLIGDTPNGEAVVGLQWGLNEENGTGLLVTFTADQIRDMFSNLD